MSVETLPSLEFSSTSEVSYDPNGLTRTLSSSLSPPTRAVGGRLSISSSSSSSSSSSAINWAQVDSSDDESQKSCSGVSLAEELEGGSPVWTAQHQHQPHRRTRSSTRLLINSNNHNNNEDDNDNINNVEERNGDDDSEARPRPVRSSNMRVIASSIVPFIARCTSVNMLLGLFLVTCYTTFWLPYPEIRPHVTYIPRFQQQQQQHQHVSGPAGFHRNNNNNTAIAAGSPSSAVASLVFHARAAPEVELEFRPALERYYEQEGFSNHAWTKYANLGALGTVIFWAVREQHRRREEDAATSSSSSQRVGGNYGTVHSSLSSPYLA
ncbi:hypothetical protein ACA910_016790 [Epithemia clementina (nom. ined.)]